MEKNINNEEKNLNKEKENKKTDIKELSDIWQHFPKYWIYCDEGNFNTKIKKMMLDKNNFFVFIYGKHDMLGFSWCSDCRLSEPFVNNIKPIIAKNEIYKEVYFLNIPVSKEAKKKFRENTLLKVQHVPTLIYFNQGREVDRISERGMSTQIQVTTFVEQVYEDIETK